MYLWAHGWECGIAWVLWSSGHYSILELTEQESIILYVFLIFWLYYAFRISKSYLWRLFGKELIKINEEAFYLKKSFMTYGKSVPYYFGNIKDFRFEIPEVRSLQSVWEASPWISGGSALASSILAK